MGHGSTTNPSTHAPGDPGSVDRSWWVATSVVVLWAAVSVVVTWWPASNEGAWLAATLGMVLVSGVVLLVLRRRPATAFGCLVVLSVGSAALSTWAQLHHRGDWYSLVGVGLTLPLALAAYRMGRGSRTWLSVVLVLLLAALRSLDWMVVLRSEGLGAGTSLTRPDGGSMPLWSLGLAQLNGYAIYFGLPAVLGMLVRRELRDAERNRAALEAERARHDEDLVRAVHDDRQRMAHELHDLAAHHTTAVVVTAKAARKLGTSRPDLVPGLMDDIVVESAGAQTSLRQMVRLLNDPDEAPLQPQPTLDEIPALVEHARQVDDDIILDQSPADVPAPVALAAYRIVQESLTNAHRHAPGAPVTLAVAPVDDVLHVEVVNGRSVRLPLEGLGTGNGLAGMRQRAELLGGWLEAGPHGRGWRVLAELPLNPVGTGSNEGGDAA